MAIRYQPILLVVCLLLITGTQAVPRGPIKPVLPPGTVRAFMHPITFIKEKLRLRKLQQKLRKRGLKSTYQAALPPFVPHRDNPKYQKGPRLIPEVGPISVRLSDPIGLVEQTYTARLYQHLGVGMAKIEDEMHIRMHDRYRKTLCEMVGAKCNPKEPDYHSKISTLLNKLTFGKWFRLNAAIKDWIDKHAKERMALILVRVHNKLMPRILDRLLAEAELVGAKDQDWSFTKIHEFVHNIMVQVDTDVRDIHIDELNNFYKTFPKNLKAIVKPFIPEIQYVDSYARNVVPDVDPKDLDVDPKDLDEDPYPPKKSGSLLNRIPGVDKLKGKRDRFVKRARHVVAQRILDSEWRLKEMIQTALLQTIGGVPPPYEWKPQGNHDPTSQQEWQQNGNHYPPVQQEWQQQGNEYPPHDRPQDQVYPPTQQDWNHGNQHPPQDWQRQEMYAPPQQEGNHGDQYLPPHHDWQDQQVYPYTPPSYNDAVNQGPEGEFGQNQYESHTGSRPGTYNPGSHTAHGNNGDTHIGQQHISSTDNLVDWLNRKQAPPNVPQDNRQDVESTLHLHDQHGREPTGSANDLFDIHIEDASAPPLRQYGGSFNSEQHTPSYDHFHGSQQPHYQQYPDEQPPFHDPNQYDRQNLVPTFNQVPQSNYYSDHDRLAPGRPEMGRQHASNIQYQDSFHSSRQDSFHSSRQDSIRSSHHGSFRIPENTVQQTPGFDVSRVPSRSSQGFDRQQSQDSRQSSQHDSDHNSPEFYSPQLLSNERSQNGDQRPQAPSVHSRTSRQPSSRDGSPEFGLPRVPSHRSQDYSRQQSRASSFQSHTSRQPSLRQSDYDSAEFYVPRVPNHGSQEFRRQPSHASTLYSQDSDHESFDRVSLGQVSHASGSRSQRFEQISPQNRLYPDISHYKHSDSLPQFQQHHNMREPPRSLTMTFRPPVTHKVTENDPQESNVSQPDWIAQLENDFSSIAAKNKQKNNKASAENQAGSPPQRST